MRNRKCWTASASSS